MTPLPERIRAWFAALQEGPDAAFPPVLRAALLTLAAVIALHFLVRLVRAKGAPRPRSGRIVGLLYVGLLLSTAALAATAFSAVLRGESLSGYALWIHVVSAGAFVGLLALTALLLGPRLAFTRPASARAGFPARLAFWGFVAAGAVAAATMLVSMQPWLGQEEMAKMLTLHRYAGLAAAACGTLHAYLVVMGRFGRA